MSKSLDRKTKKHQEVITFFQGQGGRVDWVNQPPEMWCAIHDACMDGVIRQLLKEESSELVSGDDE